MTRARRKAPRVSAKVARELIRWRAELDARIAERRATEPVLVALDQLRAQRRRHLTRVHRFGRQYAFALLWTLATEIGDGPCPGGECSRKRPCMYCRARELNEELRALNAQETEIDWAAVREAEERAFRRETSK